MIITIDGPSGTGKSTVAKKVAELLNFAFFDTGAMYRAVTWRLMQERISLENIEAVDNVLDQFQFLIREEEGRKKYFVGTEEVTDIIRTREVTAHVSAVSALPSVRRKIWDIQRKFGEKLDAVFEGRDMGTTVFPKANLKIFLTARPEVRAERRFKEFKEKNGANNDDFTSEEILHEITARDEADATRALSPLSKADDAIEIDTSDFSIDEVVDQVLKYAKSRLGSR